MSTLPYESLPESPDRASAATVIVRLLDALAFRYRWATEGLKEDEAAFRPGPDSMSLIELLRHIAMLVAWMDSAFTAGPRKEVSKEGTIAETRAKTLEWLQGMRNQVFIMDERALETVVLTRPKTGESFPIWNLLNGPLADALTHVGQINGWRRLAGNPTPRANIFQGLPPGMKPA